jgi:phosphoserine phosphatase
MNKELILIKVNGPDKPGITFKLLEVISQGKHSVKDMGQSVTHGLLSLSILLEIESTENDYPVIKDLLFAAKKLGLTLDFETFDDEGSAIQNNQVEPKFILNVVSTTAIPVSFLKETAKTFSENDVNIHRIDTIDPTEFRALEITTSVSPKVNWDKLKEKLISISNTYQVDAAFIRDDVWRRNKRLIVFDMDSTLIQTEVIDEMAIEHGVGDQVKEITEKAMNGELDFNQSLQERVMLLKGLEEKKLKLIISFHCLD